MFSYSNRGLQAPSRPPPPPPQGNSSSSGAPYAPQSQSFYQNETSSANTSFNDLIKRPTSMPSMHSMHSIPAVNARNYGEDYDEDTVIYRRNDNISRTLFTNENESKPKQMMQLVPQHAVKSSPGDDVIDLVTTSAYQPPGMENFNVVATEQQGIMFLQSQVSSLQARKSSLEHQLSDTREVLASAERKLNNQLEVNKKLQNRIAELEISNSHLHQQLKLAHEEKDGVGEQIRKFEKQELHLRQEIEYLQQLNQQYLDKLSQQTDAHSMEQRSLSMKLNAIQEHSKIHNDQLLETLKHFEVVLTQMSSKNGSNQSRPSSSLSFHDPNSSPESKEKFSDAVKFGMNYLEHHRQKTALHELKHFCLGLTESLNIVQASLEAVRHEVQNDKKMSDALTMTYRAMHQDFEQLKSTTKTLETQLRHSKEVLKAKNEIYHEKYETEISSLKSVNARLKEENEKLAKELKEARQKTSAFELEQEETQKKIESIQEDIKAKTKSFMDTEKQLNDRVKSLEVEVASKTSTIHSQQQSLADLKKYIDQLEQELNNSRDSLKRAIEDEKRKVNQEKQEEILDLRQQVASLRAKQKEMQQDLQAKQDQYTKQLERMRNENTSAKKDQEQLKKVNEERGKEITNLKQQVEQLRLQNEMLQLETKP